MSRISTNQIALGVGVAGAMVDVSSYVELDESVTYQWGRSSDFRDQAPGKMTFTLNNADGRFTPGNASSPLATEVTEGMPVAWLLGGRLRAGSVLSIQPTFPGSIAGWSRVQIVVDDALGMAARTQLDKTLVDSISRAAGQYAFWRMDGDANATFAADEVGGLPDLALLQYSTPIASPAVLFGQPPVPGLADHSVELYAVTEIVYWASSPNSSNIPYPQTDIGCWGYWVIPEPTSQVVLQVWVAGLEQPIELGYTSSMGTLGTFYMNPGNGTALQQTMPTGQALYSPHYMAFTTATTFAAGVWTITVSFYLDGVLVGSSNYAQSVPNPTVTSLTRADRQPVIVRFANGDGSFVNSVAVSRLSHTKSLAHEELAVGTTEASRLQAIAAVVPDLTFAFPTDLSLQPIGIGRMAGSVLDSVNDVIKTEQGYLWSTATGTLLAPTEVVKVRARNRPSTVTASFDVERELDNAPSFIRDVTNMVARLDVSGTDGSWSFYDGTVSGRVGSGSISDTVLNSFFGDVEAWAQDRLMRGRNVNLQIASAVVDAMTTPTDRSADLLALQPGDRVQFTNLPNTQLGFTTWDGWFLGADETHSVTEHKFTLHFAPVLDLVPARFASVTDLYLVSSVTAAATSLTVNTNGSGTPSTEVPYQIVIGSEQMDVTAVSGGGGGNWTLTVTRGINGTTAATHAANALIEIASTARFASGGDLYLVTAVNSTATSLTVNTNGSGTPSTVTTYSILIDNERMTVTAVTGGGGGNWTLTVVRGINGTTPASHAANALIDIPFTATFVF